MDRDAAVALLEARLGNRGTTHNTQIVTEMQAQQVRLEHLPELPWFLLNVDTSLATVADTKTLAVPTGFLMEDTDGQMFVIDTDGGYHRVVKGDYEVLRSATFYGTNKIPERYALVGSTIYFFPTPDAVYSLEWIYYKADDTLSAGTTENNWLTEAPELLIAATGLRMARYLRYQDIIPEFKEDYAEAYGQMIHFNEARRQAALDAYMGG